MSIALRCYKEDSLKKKEEKDVKTNGDMFQRWFELEQGKKASFHLDCGVNVDGVDENLFRIHKPAAVLIDCAFRPSSVSSSMPDIFFGGLEIISNSRNIEAYLIQTNDEDGLDRETYLSTCRGMRWFNDDDKNEPTTDKKSNKVINEWYKCVILSPSGPVAVQKVKLKLLSLRPTKCNEAVIRLLKYKGRLPEVDTSPNSTSKNADSDTIVSSSSWSATNNVSNPVTTTTSKQPPLRNTAKGKMPTVSLAATNRSPHSGTVGGGDDVKAAVSAMAMMAQATETRLKSSMEKQLSMMERRFTLRFDQLDKQLKQLTLLQASAANQQQKQIQYQQQVDIKQKQQQHRKENEENENNRKNDNALMKRQELVMQAQQTKIDKLLQNQERMMNILLQKPAASAVIDTSHKSIIDTTQQPTNNISKEYESSSLLEAAIPPSSEKLPATPESTIKISMTRSATDLSTTKSPAIDTFTSATQQPTRDNSNEEALPPLLSVSEVTIPSSAATTAIASITTTTKKLNSTTTSDDEQQGENCPTTETSATLVASKGNAGKEEERTQQQQQQSSNNMPSPPSISPTCQNSQKVTIMQVRNVPEIIIPEESLISFEDVPE